jgi:hypothetical protein
MPDRDDVDCPIPFAHQPHAGPDIPGLGPGRLDLAEFLLELPRETAMSLLLYLPTFRGRDLPRTPMLEASAKSNGLCRQVQQKYSIYCQAPALGEDFTNSGCRNAAISLKPVA